MTIYAPRHQTIPVQIDHVTVGGGAPIVVQSMTDTDTADIEKTVAQVKLLADAGSEIVRLTVNTPEAAQAVGEIKRRLLDLDCPVPLVGCFHYNGHTLLSEFPECAKALAKYRINPGNVGFGKKKDEQFNMMIDAALRYDKPVRIGVNWGSLDKSIATRLMDENARAAKPKSSQEVLHEAMVISALTSTEAALKRGLAEDKIVISCKISNVQDLIAVYRKLAAQCNYALHLGLTEAGMGSKGIVASSIGIGVLLQEGIGDTLRTSLTPEPGASREKEVIVSQQILQTMGLRAFSPMVTSCPGCGRTTSTFFRELTEQVDQFIRQKMPSWRAQYRGVETLTLAVMGCVVNGPGESKHANIGISLPGTGEAPVAPVFMDGKKVATLRGEDLTGQFLGLIEDYVHSHYAANDAIVV